METNQIQGAVSSPSQFTVSTQPRNVALTAATSAEATGAAQVAQAAFTALNVNCAAAIAPINQNQLGPYGTNGSCTHDCSYQQTWTWTADYRYINTNLLQGVATINVGGIYNTAFQPIQTWVGTNLPAFGTQLLKDLDTITQIGIDINHAGGNPTTQQLAQLKAAFTDAGQVLQANLDQANQGLRSLSNFVNQQNPNTGYLQTISTNAQTNIKTDGTKTENSLTGQIACGSGDVQNSFNAMFADVAAKFVAMQASINAADAGFQSALQAAVLVAGVFLSLQPKSQLVSEYLTQAQSYAPTDPVRQMRVNMAVSVWNTLVSEANAQLGGAT